MSPVKGGGTMLGSGVAVLLVSLSRSATASIQFVVAVAAIKTPTRQRDKTSAMLNGTWLRRDNMMFALKIA